MGGTVDFVSKQSKGSTFWIELPMGKPAKVTAADITRDVVASTENALSVQKILYVEDDSDNLVLMERIICKLSDCELLSAETAMKGLDLAIKHKPDLIILDINLPGMDGFETIKELRAQPETSHIPVFVLSASAMPDQVAKGYEAGFLAYLTKPIEIDKLLSAINDSHIGAVNSKATENNANIVKAQEFTVD
jgi:CheY-like chemotaxis protein